MAVDVFRFNISMQKLLTSNSDLLGLEAPFACNPRADSRRAKKKQPEIYVKEELMPW